MHRHQLWVVGIRIRTDVKVVEYQHTETWDTISTDASHPLDANAITDLQV
jgi:hypothetical protein